MSPTTDDNGLTINASATLAFVVMFAVSHEAVQESYAQPIIRFVPGRAQTGVLFDGNWRINGVSSAKPYAQNSLREWVELPLEGYLFNSRVLVYGVTIKPSLRQQRATGVPEPFRNRHLDINGSATLLQGRLLSFSVRGGKASGVSSGGFGTQADFESSTFVPSAHFSSRMISGSAIYTRSEGKSLTQVGPQLTPIEQNNETRTFRVRVHNSKLNAGFDRSRFDDRIRRSDYKIDSRHVYHWFRWGKGSELTTRYDHQERLESLAHVRSTWSEAVHIQHTESTFSKLKYSQYRSDGLGGKTDGHSYGWSMSSTASDWLKIGGRASRSSSRFDGGRLSTLNAGVSASAGRALGSRSRLTGNASVSYLSRDRSSNTQSVSVINELHVVPSGLTFALDELLVDRSSVVVQNASQTVVFASGLDYELVEVGSATHLIVLAGSRIQAGDTVVLDYRFAAVFDQEDNGFVAQAGATLQLPGVTVRHNQSMRETSVVGTGPSVSGDFDQSVSGLSIRRSISLGLFRLAVDRRSRQSSSISYQTIEARSSLDVPLKEEVRLFFDTSIRRVTESDDRVDLVSFSTTVNWKPQSRLRLSASGRVQDWNQRLGSRTRLLAGQVSLDYSIARVQMRVRYDYDRRSMGLETSGHRFSASVTRRM